jgi:hypothetical protein
MFTLSPVPFAGDGHIHPECVFSTRSHFIISRNTVMGGVQMMLVLAALTLLSILVLSMNRAKLFSDEQLSQAEYMMEATAVGQTLINDIHTKEFDAATATDPDAEVSSFTAPGSLGHGWWESYPNFNDVDDYNRLQTTISTPRAGNLTLACRVQYVDPAQPNTPVNMRTRTKRITVIVTSPFLNDPVTLVSYKSY